MKILVTGGTSGMGYGVAKVLAKDLDNQIIILSVNDFEGMKTVEEIIKETANPNISYLKCNLSVLADVDEVIEKIKSEHDYIDSVFINAGIGYCKSHIITEDGIDLHFQVNFLSQFKLLLNILFLLENSKEGGHVVFNATKYGKVDFEDINISKKWSYEKAIYQAMAAKRMLCYYLSNSYPENEVMFTSFNILKTVWTNQINIIPKYMKVIASIMKKFNKFISVEECGEMISPLLTMNKEDFKVFDGNLITFNNNQFSAIEDEAWVRDEKMQRELIELSVKLLDDKSTEYIALNL